MRNAVVAAGMVSAGMLVLAGGAHAAGIKEGKWSMTTTIQMDGMDAQAAQAMQDMENLPPDQQAMMQQMMGGMKIGGPVGGRGMSTTRTQCITNDHPVPEANNENGCQQTHAIKGNAVNFEVVCENSRSTGQVTYHNDSMNGTITSTQTEHGQPTTTTINISGQYVGPCD